MSKRHFVVLKSNDINVNELKQFMKLWKKFDIEIRDLPDDPVIFSSAYLLEVQQNG